MATFPDLNYAQNSQNMLYVDDFIGHQETVISPSSKDAFNSQNSHRRAQWRAASQRSRQKKERELKELRAENAALREVVYGKTTTVTQPWLNYVLPLPSLKSWKAPSLHWYTAVNSTGWTQVYTKNGLTLQKKESTDGAKGYFSKVDLMVGCGVNDACKYCWEFLSRYSTVIKPLNNGAHLVHRGGSSQYIFSSLKAGQVYHMSLHRIGSAIEDDDIEPNLIGISVTPIVRSGFAWIEMVQYRPGICTNDNLKSVFKEACALMRYNEHKTRIKMMSSATRAICGDEPFVVDFGQYQAVTSSTVRFPREMGLSSSESSPTTSPEAQTLGYYVDSSNNGIMDSQPQQKQKQPSSTTSTLSLGSSSFCHSQSPISSIGVSTSVVTNVPRIPELPPAATSTSTVVTQQQQQQQQQHSPNQWELLVKSFDDFWKTIP
eukprot:TRINITY_DN1446_c0_g1_i1.p1 TRINITY_DN1446_c0_g1~~TRINITY_DN1446_c0_g1_i1.p1  ORF type:complete len:432 (-),score=130.37 TRINITY_DN1446_c0_g1_i1:126-1421(-)